MLGRSYKKRKVTIKKFILILQLGTVCSRRIIIVSSLPGQLIMSFGVTKREIN